MNTFLTLFKVINDSIGQILSMDNATYHHTYTKVVRICVEMDMGFDLPEEIFLDSEDPLVDGYWYPLEYSKFWYCNHYHMVGHTNLYYKKKKKTGDNQDSLKILSDSLVETDKEIPAPSRKGKEKEML